MKQFNPFYDSDICPLNPDPTDVQRAVWRRHHKAGTSPGNPKWYKAPVLPKPPKPWAGQAPVYPALPSGQAYRLAWIKKRKGMAPDPFHKARGKDSTTAYVAAYETAAGLRSC